MIDDTTLADSSPISIFEQENYNKGGDFQSHYRTDSAIN